MAVHDNNPFALQYTTGMRIINMVRTNEITDYIFVQVEILVTV